MLAEHVRVACSAAPPPLKYPHEWISVLEDLPLDAVLKVRGGLPRLRAVLNDELGADPLRVCFLGGSVTEQKTGYRPRVTKWLEAMAAHARIRVEEVPAFCGVRTCLLFLISS